MTVACPAPVERGSGFALPAERQIRRIIRTRAARAKFFDPALFADPAWDILLDLYRAELAQQRVCVSSCCVASNVPPTTALRQIATLCDRGLIEKRADPLDARRIFLSLSRQASEAMAGFLRANRNIETYSPADVS